MTRAILGLLFTVVLGAVATGAVSEEPDPLPLRRVLLPQSRWSEELKRLKEGVLTRLPRSQFEQLVREAARGKKALSAPKLIEARYRASLSESSALVGTAQWRVSLQGPAPALLKLTGEGASFNLAVKQPRLDNRDAILTTFSEGDGKGRSLALYLDQPGEQTVTFEWSARTEPRPEGLLVDLRLPECPAGSLEVELPADRLLSLIDGSLVSGPHPTATPNRQLWRLPIGGKSQLTLLLRRAETEGSSLVLSWHKMTQRLSPDGLETTSLFNVEALGQDVRELVCEYDPLLRPVEVQAPEIERWDTLPVAAQQPGRLMIRLGKPLREGVIEIRCVAPLASELPTEPQPNRAIVVPWTSPSLQLLGTVPRGETLELWLHPELRLLSWQPGDYRLIDSSLIPEAEAGITLRRLTLQGGGLATAAGRPRRPGGQIQAGGVEFRAGQQSWWKLASDGMELVTQIDYELRQGQLFQLPLRLPPAWEVDTVELTPTDLLRSWGVRSDKRGTRLLVELRRPLRMGAGEATTSLVVRLRRTDGPTGEWPFPDVVPLGARYREGGLAIEFDEQTYRASVSSSFVPGEAIAGGPWGKSNPDYYYPFRGESLTGRLRIEGRPPRLLARIASELLLAGRRAVLDTRLTVEGESGTPAYVDVRLLDGEGPLWEWRTGNATGPPIRSEPLPAIDASVALAALDPCSPLHTLTLLAARPAGSAWRLWFDRPLSARKSTTLRATRLLVPRDGNLWEVPFVTVPGAVRQQGELTIQLNDADVGVVERSGLRELPRSSSDRRGYRYTGQMPRLVLENRPSSPGPREDAAIERTRLTSWLTTNGELYHHLRFRLARWPQRTLPIRLPPRSNLLAVAIAGQWLEHGARLDEQYTVALPVPLNQELVLYELLYSTSTTGDGIGFVLHAPAPELPVAPAAFERRWLLPPGLLPLRDGRTLLLPDGRHDAGPRPTTSRLLDLFQLGPAWSSQTVDSREATRRTVIDACAALCAEHGGTSLALALLVEQLVGETLGVSVPVLIDRLALGRGGYTLATRVQLRARLDEQDALAPWEEQSLILLPLPNAVILTTREQLRDLSTTVPAALHNAITDAAVHGRDVTGRYVTAVEWLSSGRTRPTQPGLFRPAEDLTGWTTWIPVAGTSEESLVVVRANWVTAGGLLLAGVLAAGLLFLYRRSLNSYWQVLLLSLAGAGLAVAWLPSALVPLAWWPLLLALALTFIAFLVWAIRKPIVATTAAVLVVVAVCPGQPTDPDDNLVLLLPDGEDPTGTVLVRPALLERLRELARPKAMATAGAVLLNASYEGRVVNDRAEFTATLQAYSFANGATLLELPFDEVQLIGDVLVDGKRAWPTALPAPRNGYLLRLSEPGRHNIELRFQTALTRTSEDEGTRQVRCSVPSLVQSQVNFQVPDGATYPRVFIKHGAQRLVEQGTTRRLEVELGAISSPLQIRWYQEPRAAKPPRLEFREAYLWDLRIDASLLTALLRYTVREGAVTSLFLDVPPSLEIRSAQARRPSDDKSLFGELKALVDPIRLTNWATQNDGEERTVRLDFPVPVSGEIEITLELVPTGPWGASVLLPLPRPRGEPDPKIPGYLAYRHQGLRVERTNWFRLSGLKPAEFAPFWTGSTRPAANSLDYASSFRRDPRQPPELSLALSAARQQIEAKQELSFLIGPNRAEVTARLELSAPTRDLSVIEIDLQSPQPWTIANVTGPEVGRWSQSGTRLLVWLEKTTSSTQFDLIGWLPLTTTKDDKKTPVTPYFQLPSLQVRSATSSRARLILRPAPGLLLEAQEMRQLTPDRPSSPSELVLVASQPGYAGNILVQPGPVPNATIQLQAQREDKELVFTARGELRGLSESRSLSVLLSDWDGDAWLETPAGSETRRREQHRQEGNRRERSWILELSPGEADPFRFTVRGRLPFQGPVSLPDLHVQGAKTTLLLDLDESLSIENAFGVEARTQGDKSIWQVSEPRWSLRVEPRPSTSFAPVQLLLGEVRSLVPDGNHWSHEARYWIRHDSPAELRIRLPAGVESAQARVDDAAATTLTGSVVALPFSAPLGIREVVIRYRFDPARESLDQPDLTPPVFDGAKPGPLLWTVQIPPGWEVSSSTGGTRLGSGATRRAVLELHRASLELELFRELTASQRTAEAMAAGQRLARSLALARLAIQTGVAGERALGPEGLALSRWLSELQQQAGDFPPLLSEPSVETACPLGTPFSWRRDRPEVTLSVRLIPSSRSQTQQAVLFTAGWVFALIALWTISISTVLRTGARWFWPEILLVLAFGLGQFTGPTVPILVVAGLGLLSRLLLLVRWLWNRSPRLAPGSTASARS